MPANVTAREGANIDDIDFTVGNNSDGFVGGYFLFYSVWNGTMFIGVNASFPAASGSINGLDKGKVYQLSFYSDSECDQGITLSTNGLIEYFQVGKFHALQYLVILSMRKPLQSKTGSVK